MGFSVGETETREILATERTKKEGHFYLRPQSEPPEAIYSFPGNAPQLVPLSQGCNHGNAGRDV